jgi:hypothetical protein
MRSIVLPSDYDLSITLAKAMRLQRRRIHCSFLLQEQADANSIPRRPGVAFGATKKPCKQGLLVGAEDEIRTRDPRLGKAMLYH